MKMQRVLALLLSVLLLVSGMPVVFADEAPAEAPVLTAAASVPTEAEAYNAMMALQSKYPEGTPWDDDNFYQWHGGNGGGFGCVGFAYLLSDAAFGTLPARRITPVHFKDVRAGDILRIYGDTHSVIVLQKNSSGVVIAEGNFNYSVHWGRTLSADDVEKADYMLTRYPASTTPSPKLATPKLSSVKNTSSGIQFTWQKVSGAEKYRVYFKTGNGGWKKIGDTTKLTYTRKDKNLKAGTKYTFTVKAVDKNGKTSGYDKTGKAVTYVKQSNVSKVENTTTGVKITWKKSSGAAKYTLYYKTTGGWKKIGTTTKTSYTWKKAKSGTKYAFTIKAIGKDGSAASYNNGKSIVWVAPPKNLAVKKSGSTGIQVSWGKVTGAAKYRVFYKTGSGGWKTLTDTTGTSYTWTEAKQGTKYSFTVRCISKDGKSYTSAYNTSGVSITLPKSSSSGSGSDPAPVPGGGTVWIPTNGGTKYHSWSNCSNMVDPRKVTESEAIARGFTRCKRCW